MKADYNSPDFKRRLRSAARQVIAEKIQRQKFLEEYFESKEFERFFRIIHAEEGINQESMMYETQRVEGLSAEQFSKVCDSVFHVLEDRVERVPGEFPHEVINYRGVGFNLMIGQGSVYWTEKLG